MAIPTTLVWTARKAAAANAWNGARSSLAAAQTQLSTQRSNLAAANRQLADLAKQIAQIRADLAASPTTPDGEALLMDLAEAVANMRAKQGEITGIEAAIALAQSEIELATASAANAAADLAEATAAAEDADRNDKQRTALSDAMSAPPLSTLPAAAAAALTAQPYTDAKARIEADFPKPLLDCARESAKVEIGRVKNDRTRGDEAAKVVDAAVSSVERRTRALARAGDAWRDYALNAKRRFDDSLAVLARVADPHIAPLSEPEVNAIQSKNPDGSANTALQDRRNAAAAKAQAVATAQAAHDAKLVAVDVAWIKAVAADVDADPGADSAVVAAKMDAAGAKTTLDSAKADLTAEMQSDLAAWQACVPDTAWQMLADFDRAARQLTDLSADPAPLAPAAAAAQADLVSALVTSDKSTRTLTALQTAAALARSLLRFDTGAEERRLVGAMRGDR
jgi:hypothetical protein